MRGASSAEEVDDSVCEDGVKMVLGPITRRQEIRMDGDELEGGRRGSARRPCHE